MSQFVTQLFYLDRCLTSYIADEGNSAHCQLSDAHNTKHKPVGISKLEVTSTLMPKQEMELVTFCSQERCLNRSAMSPFVTIN